MPSSLSPWTTRNTQRYSDELLYGSWERERRFPNDQHLGELARLAKWHFLETDYPRQSIADKPASIPPCQTAFLFHHGAALLRHGCPRCRASAFAQMYRASGPFHRSYGGFGGVGWQVWSSLFLRGREAGVLGYYNVTVGEAGQ